jgi:hypothetical protein
MGTLTIPGDIPIVMECETGKVSDSYHTFDELYDHRCLLFLAFQAMVHRDTQPYSGAWKSRNHHDGSGYDGWFIAGFALPQGQISYHIPDHYWELCAAPERETAPEWDGHTSADVVERLKIWLDQWLKPGYSGMLRRPLGITPTHPFDPGTL